MKWRVEIVQTNVFYIEAETEDEALHIAAEHRIWDEDQTAPDSYSYHHNIAGIGVMKWSPTLSGCMTIMSGGLHR